MKHKIDFLKVSEEPKTVWDNQLPMTVFVLKKDANGKNGEDQPQIEITIKIPEYDVSKQDIRQLINNYFEIYFGPMG